jgi:hypothetical protein
MGWVDYCNKKPSRDALLCGVIPKWIQNSKRKDYIIGIILSCPDWVDRSSLRSLKAKAAALTVTTGIEHHLDHDIPVHHPRVCGLSVPWNVKIVHAKHNMRKSNRWNPDQMDMFECLETLFD